MPSKKLDMNRTMMGPLKKIIYNCKQATFLIEKRAFGKISFREWIELRIHLYGCSFCRLYNEQSRSINTMVKELFRSSGGAGLRLDDNYKRDLQERIDKELNK